MIRLLIALTCLSSILVALSLIASRLPTITITIQPFTHKDNK